MEEALYLNEFSRYEMLLASFNRWEKVIGRGHETLGSGNALLHGMDLQDFAKKYSLPPAPPIIQKLSTLPIVPLEDLADDQECAICTERFIPVMENFHDLEEGEIPEPPISEKPLRLGCGHIFGDRCLQEWLFPYGENLSCPMCRDAIYPAKPTVIEARMDELIWTDFEGGRPLSLENRADLRCHMYEITSYRVRLAIFESTWTVPLKVKFEDTLDWRQRRVSIEKMQNVLREHEVLYVNDLLLAPDRQFRRFPYDPAIEEPMHVYLWRGQLLTQPFASESETPLVA